jgi:hypothetical protein
MAKEAPLRFLVDLAASTASTAFPTSSTQGVSVSDITGQSWHTAANRIAVMADITGSAPVSSDIHLYGYASDIGLWSHIGSMNAGSSITTSVKWNVTATRFRLAEFFNLGGKSYDRFMTRTVNSGAGAMSVSTWIGFPTGE